MDLTEEEFEATHLGLHVDNDFLQEAET